MKKFNISFKNIFISCIGIMIIDKIVVAFENSPELFKYGDLLYHVLASVVSIISQLAVSVAAAIIFYYCMEFLNVKRNMDKYIDLRKDLLFLIYGHMSLVRYTKNFRSLNSRKRRIDDDIFFDLNDLPYLLKDYSIWNKENNKQEMIAELRQHFNGLTDHIKEFKINKFQSEISSLKLKKDYRYIKGSADNIESIINMYDEVIGYYDVWRIEENEENKQNALDLMFDNYLDFFEETIEYYKLIQHFIESVDNKNIIDFLRMLY